MSYSYQKVNPKLSNFVRTVLILENKLNSNNYNLPLFTKEGSALICKIQKNKCQTSLFNQSIPKDEWLLKESTTLIAFFFKPFTIGAVFKIPAQELKNQPIELNKWNAQKTITLNTQISRCKSVEETLEILNHFIHSQIIVNKRNCELIIDATDVLMQNPNAETLSQLPKQFNITERTFQRIFKKYVGTTPIQYKRICQYYAAFLQLKGNNFNKQTDVVYDSGYFDQSHFIRSFIEFTDTTPNDYIQKGLNDKKQ